MILPIPNLNGTGSHELLDQQLKVLRALRAARDAMCDAAPHGRDYQCNAPGDFHKAVEEYRQQRVALDAVIAYHAQIAEHLA